MHSLCDVIKKMSNVSVKIHKTEHFVYLKAQQQLHDFPFLSLENNFLIFLSPYAHSFYGHCIS